jgi:flagellar biosynthesis GTPase FlhF
MTTPVTIEDIYKLFQKSQEESDRRFAEADRRAAEAERRFAETERRAAEAKAETERRAAEAKAETERRAAEAKIETERRAAEAKIEEERRAAEAERRAAEAERVAAEAKIEEERSTAEAKRSSKEINLQLKELGKQIGGLGAKFGSFTEGLALPSMEKILGDRFGMEVISPSVRVSKAGQHLEIDVLAYANSEINKAYVVEVKSHPREESITQLKSTLEKFRTFFPEHKDKQVYGILAAVDLSANIRDKILQEGLYVARISDQTFEMDVPDNFRPKAW